MQRDLVLKSCLALLAAASFAACGATSREHEAQPVSIAFNHPLGGSRYLFVSEVDGKVWGVTCPLGIHDLANRPQSEILRRCRTGNALGPVSVGELLKHLPQGLDVYEFERDLRSASVIPVKGIRDRYYDAWETLGRIAPMVSRDRRCAATACASDANALEVNVLQDNVSIYFYATGESGNSGNIEVTPTQGRVFYLNVRKNALVTSRCTQINVYVSREIREQVQVKAPGCQIRLFTL